MSVVSDRDALRRDVAEAIADLWPRSLVVSEAQLEFIAAVTARMADAVLALPGVARALAITQAAEPGRCVENLAIRRRFPELLCECGHTFLRHDPEDGRCDSHDMFAADVCWCGRRPDAAAGSVGEPQETCTCGHLRSVHTGTRGHCVQPDYACSCSLFWSVAGASTETGAAP